MEEGDLAAGGRSAAAKGAWICFEDEAGQGLRPPRARTWGRRGQTPAVHIRAGGTGYVSIAGMLCYKPGQRSRLIYRLHLYRRRKGESKSFAWTDYRDLLLQAHQQLGAPIIVVWDNLNRHLVPQMRAFIDEHEQWLTVYQLPSYAPDLNPTEGIWSLLKRGPLANLAVAGLPQLVRIVKRSLKKIQYRPHLIDGCLIQTGLTLTHNPAEALDIPN
ncbi:transposase [Sphaerisporangium sp. NBC_01403]|uniref:transposase n=1 Tax=Sphaerisporangium sp. NBC_01403 TaxID=2903599 RepID=UPI00324D60C0